MNVIKGDLLASHASMIIHGCNCFHTMGAGVARSIREKWPEAYEADLTTPYGDPDKLGMYSVARVGKGKCIVNAYTQYRPGRNANYSAIEKAFGKIARDHKRLIGPQGTIAYPKIGAGIAGGDWDIIQKIIRDALDGVVPHALYVLGE